MRTLPLPSRYSDHALIGEGATGRVYRVHDRVRDRALALKLVPPSDEDFLRREFETLRQIRHENLVQVFDWGKTDPGGAYYTMELVEGEDWGRRIGTPHTPDEARRLLVCILRGLAHLHCHGEVHGDLKPGNVLLGFDGSVRIADVGMGGEERDGGMTGTPGYTAPECWEGRDPDVRADLYSVGVMAYEALTGVHPFRGKTVREVVAGQMAGWVPTPGVHGVQLPIDLERAIMRSLERDPALRHRSADAFMEGLNVADPIGLILGGRFVGRRRELSELTECLSADAPEAPTALVVSGIPGSGKSSLLAQLADHASGIGIQVDWLASMDGVMDAVLPTLGEPTSEQGESTRTTHSRVPPESADPPARRLFVLDGNPVLEADYSAAMRLSRLVWAAAQERGRSGGIVVAIGVSEAGVGRDPHVRTLALPPLDDGECSDFVRGMLGNGEYTGPFIRTLSEVTGGWPLSLTDALFHLVANRLVVRRDGYWTAGETARETEIRAAASSTHWRLHWSTLSQDDQALLARLAAFPQGISAAALSKIVGADGLQYLDRLEARGWVRRTGEHVGFGSEAARTAVTKLCPTEVLMRARRDVLLGASGELDPEVAAEIRLEIEASPETINDLADAARSAARRGATDIAIQRFQRCLEAMARIGTSTGHGSIRVELAESLLRHGKPDDALEVLSPLTRGDAVATTPDGAARASRIAGLAHITRGDHASGKASLRTAVSLAQAAGAATEGLRARAALAELAWTHGTAEDRAETIAEISAVLSSRETEGADADVRAELAYSLGSALSRTGRRTDSREVLEAAYEWPCSDYWKMRVANSIVAVEYFTSRYEQALLWSERALQHADRAGSDDMRPRILGNRAGVYYARGQLRESTEQDRMVLHWARRIGSLFELASANSNFAVDKFLRAEYSEAQTMARETVRLADLMNDRRYGAKGRETDALCYLMVGKYQDAERLVKEAKELLASDEYVGLKPRLDWLDARVRAALGEASVAGELLDKAERALLSTDDWEDLWGIQVERCLLDATAQKADRAIASILEIVAKAEKAGLYLVSYLAIGAAAQVALGHRVPHAGAAHLARSILPRSEEAGLDEVTWTLSLFVGTSDLESGDAKAAHSRFAHSLRIIRRIADSLPVDHRRSYLETPRVRTALDRMN